LQCLQGAKVRNWTPNQIIKAGWIDPLCPCIVTMNKLQIIID
jgi:hypothetical protein